MLHRVEYSWTESELSRLSSAFVIIMDHGWRLSAADAGMAGQRPAGGQTNQITCTSSIADNFAISLSLDDLQIAMRSDLHVGIPLGYTFSPSKARRTGKS